MPVECVPVHTCGWQHSWGVIGRAVGGAVGGAGWGGRRCVAIGLVHGGAAGRAFGGTNGGVDGSASAVAVWFCE